MNHLNEKDYVNETDPFVRRNTPFQECRPSEPEEPVPVDRGPESVRRRELRPECDPGNQVLFPDYPFQQQQQFDVTPDSDRERSVSGSSDDRSEDAVRRDFAMTSQVTATQPTDVPLAHQPALQLDVARPRDPPKAANTSNDQSQSPENVNQRFRESVSQGREDSVDLVARPRIDSAQQSTADASPSKQTPQTPQRSPLKLETVSPSQPVSVTLPSADFAETSPRLRKHTVSVAKDAANKLPAVQNVSPTKGTAITSPQSLPSVRHLIHQLNEQDHHLKELAEAATAAEARVPAASSSHHHSQSFGSTTSQSPILPYHSHSNVSHTSPLNVSLATRSPVSAIGDGPSYISPQQQNSYAYYNERRRRSSTIVEHPPPFLPPVPSMPSMPSASSSGESRGRAASSTDGYSTSHTTPVDSGASTEASVRGLPSLSNMPGPFKCDDPNCNHAFQTQYLLSSHKNVHSQDRPHYCPVQDCPRGEGGRGFKRKNEMIRHGLVHSSPGYICPFCPDRNHRYPRPDNLQRHVRVHHVDKDKDDPALREVLSQRAEGTGKARRRRTQGSNGSSG